MTSGVYVAGTGLACSLGADVPTAIEALRRCGAEPTLVRVAEGFSWPVHTLAPAPGTWIERLSHCVRRVVAECGAPTDAELPLFVASSSLDAGYEEGEGGDAGPFAGDLQTFADVVASALGWQGPVFTVSTACTSAVNAVLAAAALIRAGEASQALVLGIEFGNRFTVAGFGAMQLLSPDRARPFGAQRNGLVLGEAVAALHLQAAPTRWQIAGGANVVDGRNPTGAAHDAILAMCDTALRSSGLQASDIDLVKPQAAGSPGNDAVEAEALREVFGSVPPMVAFKGLIGHTLGASGAAELILLMACVEQRAWPAAQPCDPQLAVSLAATPPARLRHLLLNAIGFGGGHAALVLRDCNA